MIFFKKNFFRFIFSGFIFCSTQAVSQEFNHKEMENISPQDLYYLQGQKYYHEEKFYDAIFFFEKTLKYIQQKPEGKVIMILYNMHGDTYSYIDTSIDLVEKKWYIQQIYSSLGDAYYALNDIINAFNYYDSSIALWPGQYYSYHKKGEVYSTEEDYDRAIDNFTMAAYYKPSPLYQFYIGYCYYKLKNYPLAIKYCENSLKSSINEIILVHSAQHIEIFDTLYNKISIKEKFPVVYQILGDAYFILSDYNNAITYYDSALLINPKSYEAYYFKASSYFELGQFVEAIDNYNHVLALKGRTKNEDDLLFKAHLYNNLAYCYNKTGQYLESLSYYDTLILIDKKNSDNYFERANNFFELKNYGLALLDYDKALSIDNQPRYLLGKANCLYALKRFKQAAQILEKIIYTVKVKKTETPNPLNSNIMDTVTFAYKPFFTVENLTKIANAYYELKKYELANNYFDSLLKQTVPDWSNINFTNILNKKIQCLINLKYIHAAIELINIMIENKFNKDLVLQRAICYFKLNNIKMALSDYNLLLKKDSFNQEALFERGYTYYEIKNYDAAIKDFSRLIQVNNDLMLPYFYQGLSYEKQGNMNEALKNYNSAILLTPENSELYLHCAKIFCKLNNFEQAKINFERYAKITGETKIKDCSNKN